MSNGLNQYTSSTDAAVTTNYGYDSKGNLTSDGTLAFGYSSENLLKTGPNSSALTYDPLTRLFQLTSGAATTRWGYDGLNMIAEYNGSNALLRRHVFAPGHPGLAEAGQPIVTYEGATVSSATRRFLSADERGSIIAVSDSNGAKLSTNGYDEFGIPQSPASATAGTAGRGTIFGRFGYTGQAWLPEVGLYYYKARVYSPGLGRFLQTDPIGYADQANLYGYVMNDPVNFTDPLGLQCNPQQVGSCNPIPVTACQNGGAMPYCVAPLMDVGFAAGPLSFADMNGGEPGSGRGTSDENDEKAPCAPTTDQLEGSGKVHYKFAEVNTSVFGTAAVAHGDFTTDAGYSGTFTTASYGYSFGAKAPGASEGKGTSENLSKFRGQNYNVVGTLGPCSISDNFDTSGKHVGETNGVSTPGVSIGGSTSYTVLKNVMCPK